MTKTKRKSADHRDGYYSFCKWVEGEPEWSDDSDESWPTREEAEAAARKARATHVFKIEKAHPKRVCPDSSVYDFLCDLAMRWDGGGQDSSVYLHDDAVEELAGEIRKVLRKCGIRRGGWRARAMWKIRRPKR